MEETGSLARGEPTTRKALAGWARLIVGVVARAYLVFLLALAACATVPMIAGLGGSIVQSGSMRPLIEPGDVVLAVALPADAPTPLGHVVTFTAPPGSIADGLILHRIVGVNPDGSLVTAGDANADVDSTPLQRVDIIARACLLIPWIGLPAFWLSTDAVLPLVGWLALTAAAIAIEVVNAQPRHRRAVARRRGLAPAIVIAGVAVIVVAAPGLAPADAAFSARTSSLGASWTAAIAAPATQLAFAVSLSNSTGGVPSAIQPVVEVRNAAGKLVTGTRTVEVTLTNASGAALTCVATRLTGDTGRMSFAGCAIDKVGSYTITARSGTLTPAVSSTVVITRGPAVRLTFTTSPSPSVTNATFVTQPLVSLLDAGGNLSTSTASVALKLTTAGGATLTCTGNPRNAISGTAQFAGCHIDKAGSFTLTATSGTLPATVSSGFVISAPPAPLLTCNSSIWMATYSWSPTPYTPTVYRLYVNGTRVPATGADGWNSYVQLTSNNVPATSFPQGVATVEVRVVLSNGQEQQIGVGKVTLGPAGYRTYLCG